MHARGAQSSEPAWRLAVEEVASPCLTSSCRAVLKQPLEDGLGRILKTRVLASLGSRKEETLGLMSLALALLALALDFSSARSNDLLRIATNTSSQIRLNSPVSSSSTQCRR